MKSRKAYLSRNAYLMVAVMAIGTMAATATALAWQSPTEHRYLTKPLHLCDRGTFYVGGAPKITPFATSATPQGQRQIIIGQMYVQFATPMVSKAWPLIMVHGSGYTGSAVEGTAGGNEGWSDYTVRNGVPTYVVDQPGRGRSGFDHTPIHEAIYKINNGDIPGALALLPGGGTQPEFGFSHEGTRGFAQWFGRFVPSAGPNTADEDVTASQMVRHGDPADPDCVATPSHCTFLGRLPMEPEAPWAVDQAIKSRSGVGAPAGIGTVTPDNPQVAANASYLALDAYKFDLPNAENFLPFGDCPTCDLPGGVVGQDDWWSSRALAELIEGIGGAIVATHSQSGIHGHHLVRILKDHGTLDLLKGLITIEGSCSLTQSATTAADFVNIPYMVFIGDYTGHNATCQASVAAINAAGGNAEYVKLDEAGWWQGSYAGPFGDAYVGPFRGVSHMMMIEDNPAPDGDGRATNLQVMDVMLEWADNNVSKPKTQACGNEGGGPPDGVPPGPPNGVPPGPPAGKGKNS